MFVVAVLWRSVDGVLPSVLDWQPMKIYLDNCCFNRPYDDQTHLDIRLEAEAKLRIQEEIRHGVFELVWSYLLDYENGKNPFMERREQISKWRMYATEDIIESKGVLKIAAMLRENGLKKIDSLHVACAIHAGSDYFLTTDNGILKRAVFTQNIQIIDPIGFIIPIADQTSAFRVRGFVRMARRNCAALLI